MKIVFFNLAGPNFPGGCEKYFSILANHFSSQNQVYFLHSKQYIGFMEWFYHILSGHKVGSIDYVKRDIGKSEIINFHFSALVPFSKENIRIKSVINNSDIVYSKNEFQELIFLYYILGQKKFSQKVVIGVHSAIFIPNSVKGIWKFIHNIQYKSLFYKKFLKSAKFIHTINSDDKVRINEYYGINERKIRYIPIFIDWRTTFVKNNNAKKFTILWAGRLTEQKGIDRLIRIIEALAGKNFLNHIQILIAGAGEEVYREPIQALAKKYKNVKFLGFINNISSIYRRVDLSIITSYFETFGYNVLEPQSFGIPVVSYNIVGPKDIIEDGKTGILVNSDKEFIDSVIGIYNNRKRFNKKIIFKTINSKFSKDKLFKDIETNLFIYA